MSKNILLSFFLVSISFFSLAQDKQLRKIKKYLDEGKSQKSIEKATEYIQKNPRSGAAPYFYLFSGYYKQYEEYKDYTSLKLSARYLYKGMRKKDAASYRSAYKKETDELHGLLKQYAYNYYEAGDPKAKPFYDYLAKIYNDTLKQYREVMFPITEQKEIGADIVERTRAGEINQIDSRGRKQGKWTKVYPNGETAYEAFFKDNKPVGELKRFHENGKLAALLIYPETGNAAQASFFNQQGEKISEGKYQEKNKIGLWIYYSGKKKIKEESYNEKGLLHGEQLTFYPNGKLYDKKHFVNGKEEGSWEKFFDNGKKMLQTEFKQGKLDGKITRYHKNGTPELIGQYKNDKKEGTWIFYGEEKGQKETVQYKNGKNLTHPDHLEQENESYRKQLKKSQETRRQDPTAHPPSLNSHN